MEHQIIPQLILAALLLIWTALVWNVAKKQKTKELEQDEDPNLVDISQFYMFKSKPYHFRITNDTDEIKTAKLFGRNFNLLNSNFGSDAGLKITPLEGDVTYVEVLEYSSQFPFNTTMIVLKSTNKKMVTQILTFLNKNSDGEQVHIPIIPIISQTYYHPDSQGNDEYVVQIPMSLLVSGNSQFSLPILSKTELIIEFYAKEEFDLMAFMDWRNKPKEDPYFKEAEYARKVYFTSKNN